MHIQYIGGLSMQDITCNGNQKPDCNSLIPYGIIIFYYPYKHKGLSPHVTYGLHMFMKSRLKGTWITGHQLQC